MAAANTKTVVALLLFVCIVESELSLVGAAGAPPIQGGAGPTCSKVIGVKKGDICYDIAKKYTGTLDKFYEINPNINCYNLFIGQWVCVEGTPGK